MERKIKVGENEVMFKSSAATNILYKKAFGEDILVKLTEYTKNLKELKKIHDTLTDGEHVKTERIYFVAGNSFG